MTATIQARSTRQPAFINTGSAGALRAASLHRPRRGEPQAEIPKGKRLGTVLFMAAIHVLAVVALLRQRCIREHEEPLHGAGPAGDDRERTVATGEFRQMRVAAGGHLAEIGHHLEAAARRGQTFEHGIFHGDRHDLRVGAAAIDDANGVGGGGCLVCHGWTFPAAGYVPKSLNQ